MPHKRNPILAERVTGMARLLRADALVGLENMALWHERDISHSSAERFVFERALGVAAYATRILADDPRRAGGGCRTDAREPRPAGRDGLFGGAAAGDDRQGCRPAGGVPPGAGRGEARLGGRSLVPRRAGSRSGRRRSGSPPTRSTRQWTSTTTSPGSPRRTRRSGWSSGRCAAGWRAHDERRTLAADRAELWIPGTLAALAFLGWLPLVIAVVPFPDTAGLTFFGADLVSSGSYPLNVLLLGVAGLLGMLSLCLLVALGEAALQRALRPLLGGRGSQPRDDGSAESLTAETAVVFVVILVALLPAVAAAFGLALWVAASAPAEFMSPDIGGTPVMRVIGDVLPGIVLLALVVVAAQAFGGAVERRAIGPAAEPLGRATRNAIGDLARRPVITAATLGATTLALIAQLGVSTLVLAVLWKPIRVALDAGDLATPSTILLLVGFTAIWLCLLLAGGALNAWASAWWSLGLDRPVATERAVAA